MTTVRRAVTSERESIAGPVGPLEALVEAPTDRPRGVAVVCHPHPLHQGTMHNKVAFTLARSFYRLGAAAVRFNFRGVGESEGVHADGRGEIDDATAVCDWAAGRWPGAELYLAGFSFGAMIAIAAACRRHPRALVTVAPPVERFPPDLGRPRCRWLIVQGDADEIVSATAVAAWHARLGAGAELVMLPGVGHYFDRRLTELGEVVRRFAGSDFGAAEARGDPNDVESTE
jgi:uncharacterized protein